MMACTTGLSCVIGATSNSCGACGGAGQPCCGTGNNGSCTAGLACAGRDDNMGMPGMCGACGADGQLCCPNLNNGADGGATPACMAVGSSCMLGAVTNQCGACGGSGQPCCGTGNTGSCMTGFGCAGRVSATRMTGTCGACGAAGQPCCSGGGATACMTGLACRMAMCAAATDGGVVDAAPTAPDVPADMAASQ
jgi:hypothetical protein